MTRFQVTLDGAEADALAQLAASELRDPRDQLRVILRQELTRLGLLPLGQLRADCTGANQAFAGEGAENQALTPTDRNCQEDPAAETTS